MRLRNRLFLTLVPATVLFLVVLMAGAYYAGKKALVEQVQKRVLELARMQAREFDLLCVMASRGAETLAASVESQPQISAQGLDALTRDALSRYPHLHGMAVAFEPGKHPLGRFGTYSVRQGDVIDTRRLETGYPDVEWYRAVTQAQAGKWSEPYFESGDEKTLLIAYSAPIRRDNQVVGVAKVDVPLAVILEQLKTISHENAGRAFIVSSRGYVIGHPQSGLVSKEPLEKLSLSGAASPEFSGLTKRIGNPGEDKWKVVDPETNTESWYIEYPLAALSNTPSGHPVSLIMGLPSSVVLQPLHQLGLQVAGLGLGLIVVLSLVLAGLSTSLTSPIRNLAKETQRLAKGDYDAKLNEDGKLEEIRELSATFNGLGDAIKARIAEVERTTEQKERYHQELVIASEIQSSILPRQFPPFPELADGIDLFGLMRPAKEVGGDLFDFIPLPDGKIAFLIGDVSGKGAPAAFFMAMARMLVRTLSERGWSPPEILRRANLVLEKENPKSMFVTLLYCEFDPRSGQLRMASAGHNPPLLVRAGGAVRNAEIPPALPLGAMKNIRYAPTRLALSEGDLLLLYTDGVTEAVNSSQEMFGNERLEKALSDMTQMSCEEIAKGVVAAVDSFSAGGEQFDDITVVAFRFKKAAGADGTEAVIKDRVVKLELPASTAVLGEVAWFAEAAAERAGFDLADRQRVAVALDEIVTNVIMHSYRGRAEERFTVEFEPFVGGLRIEVLDTGLPFEFDKASETRPGIQMPEDDGLGLFLAKSILDEIKYEPGTYLGNRTLLVKRLKEGERPRGGR